MTHKKPCIDVIGSACCTGCFGCQSTCTRGAIELSLDPDGFYKPNVDRAKCNGCGICQRRCPVILENEGGLSAENKEGVKVFAAWSEDEFVRLAGSSGGIFSELARPVIEAGGAVAGCVWGEKWTPEHVLVRTWLEVARMCGSKYVPSRVGDIYHSVSATLRDSEKSVLFSGTPCQVAAMNAALTPEERKRTLLVDFICHGVPSLRVFHKYLAELFGGDAVVEYTFRDKSLGWQTVKAITLEGVCHRVPASKDDFFRGFSGHHLYVMNSCHECQFARLPRSSDITLGDFWGCPEQWDDQRGVSVVLANSLAGMSALECIRSVGRIHLAPTDLTTAMAKNPRVTSGRYPIPNDRRAFLDGLAKGAKFAKLKAKYFPSRWRLLWISFRYSKSKLRFIAGNVYRGLSRTFKL